MDNNFQRLLESEVIKKFTDKETNTEFRVGAISNGRFSVTLWDLDANLSTGSARVFSDKVKALKWAADQHKKATR